MAEDEKKSAPASSTTTTTTAVKAKTPEEKGLVKVELLAKSWDRPKQGPGKSFRRFNRGDLLYVTKDEFEALNYPDAFKPAFRIIED